MFEYYTVIKIRTVLQFFPLKKTVLELVSHLKSLNCSVSKTDP